MINEETVLDIVLEALRNLNNERDEEHKISVGIDTPLFGTKAALDSLGLVSVIVDVETAISDKAGRYVSLTADDTMAQEVSPFADVRSLTNYIMKLLANDTSGLHGQV